MASFFKNQIFEVYGLSQPIVDVFPEPLVSQTNPTVNDSALKGTIWINEVTFSAYVQAGYNAGVPQWVAVGGGGAAGVFSSLLVTPGPVTLNGLTNINNNNNADTNINTGTSTGSVVIGNLANGSDVSLLSSGDITIGSNDNVANAIIIAANDAAGGVEIGGAFISIGDATNTESVTIASLAPTVNRTVTVAAGTIIGANTDIINLGTGGVSTNAGATRTVNILSGSTTLGTQTLNLGTGNRVSGTLTVNIGTGTGIKVIGIGNADGLSINAINGLTGINTNVNANTNINTGTSTGTVSIGNALATAINMATVGTITLASNGATGGLVSVTPATDTQASPTATSVLNVKQGVATFTGFTTAAAASQVFTITNALVAATSGILVSAGNTGANDAQMTVQRVTPGAGSFTVTVKNNGAAALNGNVIISFWALN